MTWSVDTGIRVDAIITNIATRLTASGWTLTDRAADQVWDSTNDHGVHQYIQITEGGAYQYLQFQAWRTWDTGTHAGTDGSGTTLNRLYYASANVAAATLVDLYMSVTANRFIIFIKGVGNFNNWTYFGGFTSLIGTDPMAALLLAAFSNSGPTNYSVGAILQSYSSGSYWVSCLCLSAAALGTADNGTNAVISYNSILGYDPARLLAFPIYISGSATPYLIRGCLDGLLFVPNSLGSVSTLDTITIGGVTHLIIQPGGSTTTNSHPMTGNYIHCLAITES